MGEKDLAQWIKAGQTALGIEFGSTRIKAVLIGEGGTALASGGYGWENRLENGVWTYALADVWAGLQTCYAALASDVRGKYGLPLETVGAIGISGMMHGYLPFDRSGKQLAAFRTWRNTMTGEAAERLTALFDFNIPQRWSIAHLYQAMLNGEDHVPALNFVTTLAGYVHHALTGERVAGVGEASGIFPVDGEKGDYDAGMLARFDALAEDAGVPWRLRQLLPRVLPAGAPAGSLTPAGARLLDPTGTLRPGIPFAPPEGDAGTGMAATNAVAPRTANVSAGTSVFLMAVLDRPLTRVYPEIDRVTTPTGAPVAMIHANTCTSDLNAWIGLFGEAAALMGGTAEPDVLFPKLFNLALAGEPDCGGLTSYNYLAAEPVSGLDWNRPLFVREPDGRLTLANFMRAQLYAAVATMRLGLRILDGEHLTIDRVLGHGGFFKVSGVGQRVMSAALEAPVTVMQTAGEGGPWGMALLAAYMREKAPGETLEDYLNDRIFAGAPVSTVMADETDRRGFEAFMTRYGRGLAALRAAEGKLK